MESALSPREIQQRIRAGLSVQQVAQMAGVDVERIDAFAAPVLAEREHILFQARRSPLRRAHHSSEDSLANAVQTGLSERSIDPDDIQWEARRDDNRQWIIDITWLDDIADHKASFRFDQRGRFCAPMDDEARDLVNDRPQSTQTSSSVEDEPTIDLHDELAMVRLVQDDHEPPVVVPDIPRSKILQLPADVEPVELDDYTEAEFEQVDGVYDIVPHTRSDMDVLYDMLAGFNEDSVRIYTDLTRPVAAQVNQDEIEEAEIFTEENEEQPSSISDSNLDDLVDDVRSAYDKHSHAEATSDLDDGISPIADEDKNESTSNDSQQPVQEALIGQAAPVKKPKKKRASVPSWDQIMFGAPKPKK